MGCKKYCIQLLHQTEKLPFVCLDARLLLAVAAVAVVEVAVVEVVEAAAAAVVEAVVAAAEQPAAGLLQPQPELAATQPQSYCPATPVTCRMKTRGLLEGGELASPPCRAPARMARPPGPASCRLDLPTSVYRA